MVDRQVGAHLTTHCELGLRARGRDHTRAGGLGKLNRSCSDTTRAAVDEHNLSGLQARAAVEPKPARLVVDEKRRGLRERHRLRDLQNCVGLGMRDLCVAAPLRAVLGDSGEDAVSRLKSAAGRRRFDFACHLGAGHEGQLRLDLIRAANLEQVEKIDRCRADTYPDELCR